MLAIKKSIRKSICWMLQSKVLRFWFFFSKLLFEDLHIQLKVSVHVNILFDGSLKNRILKNDFKKQRPISAFNYFV